MLRRKRFILYDKRNIIHVKSDKNRKKRVIANVVNTLPSDPISNIELITLKWFDIFYQELIPLQIILVIKDKITVAQLIDYVQNNFIATTEKQKEWHNKLLESFGRIKHRINAKNERE